MGKFLALLLLLFALCFAEDSPRCRELFDCPDFVRETLKMPHAVETETQEECDCLEMILCGNEKYCIAFKCPDFPEPISAFKTDDSMDIFIENLKAAISADL